MPVDFARSVAAGVDGGELYRPREGLGARDLAMQWVEAAESAQLEQRVEPEQRGRLSDVDQWAAFL